MNTHSPAYTDTPILFYLPYIKVSLNICGTTLWINNVLSLTHRKIHKIFSMASYLRSLSNMKDIFVILQLTNSPVSRFLCNVFRNDGCVNLSFILNYINERRIDSFVFTIINTVNFKLLIMKNTIKVAKRMPYKIICKKFILIVSSYLFLWIACL